MQKKRFVPQFFGYITPRQAAAGIEAALTNARSLYGDAQLLLEKERWGRAAALSILAIEEVGKVPIIREILLARNSDDLKVGWHSYRTHTAKSLIHLWPVLATKGARHLEDFREIYDRSREEPPMLDAIKQLGFYSDACGKCNWSLPEEVIDSDLARGVFSLAKFLVSRGPGAFESEPELEIWVKHLKPVWKGPMSEMKKALLACYAEAQGLGVLRGGLSAGRMMNFLFNGASSARPI
jgi:AbiV family abortive infection protein